MAVDQELTAEGKSGMMAAIIGSVTTSFKKEIRIFQKYEVWSRVLTWDKKWIYIVSHFVQKERRQRKDLVTHQLSTGMFSGNCRASKSGSTAKPALPVVFATSVSKYVFKKGRLTVPPERLLRASGLLGKSHKMGDFEHQKQKSQPKTTGDTFNEMNVKMDHMDLDCLIEEERLKGFKYAKAWAELESLHEDFLIDSETADCVPIIGHFNDITGYGFSYR